MILAKNSFAASGGAMSGDGVSPLIVSDNESNSYPTGDGNTGKEVCQKKYLESFPKQIKVEQNRLPLLTIAAKMDIPFAYLWGNS